MIHHQRRGGDVLARHVFELIVGDPDYPCLGARSVLRQGRATVRGYPRPGTPEPARLLLADLAEFTATTTVSDGFASFVAVFLSRRTSARHRSGSRPSRPDAPPTREYSMARRMSAILHASHPVPTVGVTAYATTLAAVAGNDVGRCILLAAAVLAGQASIGWSNDLMDVSADRAVARQDKPLVTAELSIRVIEIAIAVALPITIGLSLTLGWRAGLVHLAAVGCGWVYNRWLKGSWFSAVPYALAFGALPAVATLALPHPAPPAWWSVATAGLLGIAANLTNALPDLERDRQTGSSGMPSRIGARPSVALATMLLIAAGAVLGFGPAGPPGVTDWIGMAVLTVIAVALAPLGWRHARGRSPFYALMLVVPVLLAMLAANGHQLR